MNFRLFYFFTVLLFGAAPAVLATGIEVECSHRIIVIPPHVSDAILAETLAERVMTHYSTIIKKKLYSDDCKPFFDYQETTDEMDRIGFTSNFQPSLVKIKPRQLRLIHERTEFTHFLEIETNDPEISELYQVTNPQIQLRINYYAVNLAQETLVLIGSDQILIERSQVSKHDYNASILSRWLSRITPNSVAIGSGSSRFRPEFDSPVADKLDVVGLHSHGVIPPIISSTLFTRVEHPDGYRLFDYEFSVFPATQILFINQDIRLKRTSLGYSNSNSPEPISFHDLTLKFTAACTEVSGQVSLFSLIGTTYAALGVGLCVIHNESEGKFAQNYIDNSYVIQFGHRVFLSKKYFLSFETENLGWGHKIYKSDIASINSMSRATVALGYYVADAEGIFARTWKKVFD